MTHISKEGKFNENSSIIDAEFFKLKNTLSLYVLENEGERLLIDTGETLTARKIVKKLKEFNLYPIQKIFLSHAHWDHIQALPRLKKLMKDTEIEVLAHVNAIDILKHPEKMNEYFGYSVEPIEDVTPLKEGDVIDLNGFELRVIELFGHTQDSIALLDEKNKNIFVGDAIIDMLEENTYFPVLFGPAFNEDSLLNTYKKLRGMKEELNAISLAHFGVYTDDDFHKLVDNVEDLYFKAKNAIIQFYNENPNVDYVTEKYLETIIPNSKIFSKDSIHGVQWNIEQNIQCLKAAGFLK